MPSGRLMALNKVGGREDAGGTKHKEMQGITLWQVVMLRGVRGLGNSLDKQVASYNCR